MARMASEISGQSQGRRMPVSGRGDEVDQLAESFNSMLERIDNLIHGLREVTQTLAHDLRTPITGIRGMAEVTLRTERDPESYRMTLYRIMEQLDRLLGLSNVILDVAEAEAGALVLRHEPVPLHELAWDLMETFEPVAVDKGLRIDASIVPDLIVTGDPARLAQVFANLLDNAIKYTSGGGHIMLSLDVDPTGEGIVITVADDGVGISEKDLPHIFERHYRGEKSLSRPGSGSGLGLTLVRGIVENHGGHVTVDSQLGKGCTFTVFLPFG
jgi:signal transduction histidine kinase